MICIHLIVFVLENQLVVGYPLPWPLLVIHQPASPSIWPAIQSPRRGLFANPGVTMWCVCGCSWRDDVCRMCGCYRGGIVVMDVIWCRLRVSMIWERVMVYSELGKDTTSEARSMPSELIMCGGRVCSILLFPLVARCLETIEVCIWHMFVFMSVVVTV